MKHYVYNKLIRKPQILMRMLGNHKVLQGFPNARTLCDTEYLSRFKIAITTQLV